MHYRIQFKPYKRKFVRPVRLGKDYFSTREGAIVRLQDEDGEFGYGEIAPLPHFATENLSEALHFCRNLGGEITESQIVEIPHTLPCVRNAFATARDSIAQRAEHIGERKCLRTAALLPAGDDAVDQAVRLAEKGFTTFKWKIGLDDFDSQEKTLHFLVAALPPGGRLRLDANGVLNEGQAVRWLELLQGCNKIEFLEQPLPVECLHRMRSLAETYSTPIALDESATGLNSLQELVANGWTGPLVVKTSILGSPKEFLQWSAHCPNPLIFTSAFETAIGFQAGLSLADMAGKPDVALGFGTNRFLAEDGFSMHGNGPKLNLYQLSPEEYLQIWEKLEFQAKPRLTKSDDGKTLLLCEKDPVKFQAAFFDALEEKKCRIFLADPDWGISRWRNFFELVQPDEICGLLPEGLVIPKRSKDPDSADALGAEGAVFIPTGGSTGGLRFAAHTRDTLAAAVESFASGFGIATVNSFCVLPLHHVSGLMQLVRARQTGGKVIFGNHKELVAGRFPGFDPGEFMISLVALQLRRLLDCQETTAWLKRFKLVLLGGGKIDEGLLESARKEGIRLAPSYGMTETAAVCSALTPEEFLDGQKGSGRALPGVDINIHDDCGQSAETGTRGRIHIRSKSLCLGYYPDMPREQGAAFVTGDEGYIDSEGNLHVTGRLDRIIITGGEKVNPAELEYAIMETGLVADVLVYGVNDQEWGQKIVALYVPLCKETSPNKIKESIRNELAPSQVPKSWKRLREIPRNALGKIDIY